MSFRLLFKSCQIFSRADSEITDILGVHNVGVESIEKISFYKYLGIWLDDRLSLKVHIAHLMKKLKVRLGFYYRNGHVLI